MAITHFRENSGTKTLHKMLQIYPKKVGISMNRVCPRVLTFLIVYLVKSVPNFHRPLPHCALESSVIGSSYIHFIQNNPSHSNNMFPVKCPIIR